MNTKFTKEEIQELTTEARLCALEDIVNKLVKELNAIKVK